jgi:hypothetical protein
MIFLYHIKLTVQYGNRTVILHDITEQLRDITHTIRDLTLKVRCWGALLINFRHLLRNFEAEAKQKKEVRKIITLLKVQLLSGLLY